MPASIPAPASRQWLCLLSLGSVHCLGEAGHPISACQNESQEMFIGHRLYARQCYVACFCKYYLI